MNRNYYEIETVGIYEETFEIFAEDKCIRESIREYYEGRYEGTFEMKSCGRRFDDWYDYAA